MSDAAEDDEEPNKKGAAIVAAVIGVLCFALWAVNLCLGYFFWDKTINLGTLGDGQNIANSVFAGGAFIGVFYSVMLQRDELRIARKDSRRMAKVMEEQERNIAEQQVMAREANFERTFFELLRVFTELTTTLKFTDDSDSLHVGKEVFGPLIKEHDRLIPIALRENDDYVLDFSLQDYKKAYVAFGVYNSHIFGHYFRILYKLIKYVDESSIRDKSFYSELVRAQLSEGEATLLMLNYISPYTTPRFNELVARYAMLKNANPANTYAIKFSEFIPEETLGKTHGRATKEYWSERKNAKPVFS